MCAHSIVIIINIAQAYFVNNDNNTIYGWIMLLFNNYEHFFCFFVYFTQNQMTKNQLLIYLHFGNCDEKCVYTN